MNDTDQNYTDNFFKQGLSSPPEFSPSDKNWEEMERLLKRGAKRRSVAWIYTVSGLAAAILIFISLWQTNVNTGSENQQAKAVKVLKKDGDAGNQPNPTPNALESDNLHTVSPGKPGDIGIKLLTPQITRTAMLEISPDGFDLKDASSSLGEPSATGAGRTSVLNSARIVTVQTSNSEKTTSSTDIGMLNSFTLAPKTAIAVDGIEDTRAPKHAGKWALSLALSPDVNSVNNMHYGDLGVSMGMGLSYKLGKTLSIGTGIYYSQKQYGADKASYKVTEKPFATWTSYSKKIEADCRVIDVPVNLSLQISNKTSNKIYASAGMSSYIMLSEKYDFIYNGPSPAFPTGRREYTVRNENKHLLSVVNLAVALEKPLSDQVSLVIQPYAKLPLTGIGQGQTNLKSVGVGFGLNYALKKK